MAIKTTIKAGGGLVTNPKGEILMIFRRSRWDLPKGKLEAGETIEECALREVREECGIDNLALGEFLCTTHHEYIENGRAIDKESHWFTMSGSGTPKPQTEEDITQARWVSRTQAAELLGNSYDTIREVFYKFLILNS